MNFKKIMKQRRFHLALSWPFLIFVNNSNYYIFDLLLCTVCRLPHKKNQVLYVIRRSVSFCCRTVEQATTECKCDYYFGFIFLFKKCHKDVLGYIFFYNSIQT